MVSYNINGMLNSIKRSKILLKFRGEGVQAFSGETHLAEIEYAKLRRGLKHVFESSCKSGHRRGAAIFILSEVQKEHISET